MSNLTACLPMSGMAQPTYSVSHGTKKGPCDSVLRLFVVNRVDICMMTW